MDAALADAVLDRFGLDGRPAVDFDGLAAL